MAETAEAAAKKKAIAGVQVIFDRYFALAKAQNYAGADWAVMNGLKIIDADPAGGVTYELKVVDEFLNLNGVMHGGAIALMFDMSTTSALGPLARRGFWDFLGGVTRSLTISYLRGIPKGSTVILDAKVEQAGRTMAYIYGTCKDKETGATLATCVHHKVGVPAKADHMVVQLSSVL